MYVPVSVQMFLTAEMLHSVCVYCMLVMWTSVCYVRICFWSVLECHLPMLLHHRCQNLRTKKKGKAGKLTSTHLKQNDSRVNA